jgi:capsular exopolysaccharide synthesis family protein
MENTDHRSIEERQQSDDAVRAIMEQEAFHHYRGLVGQIEIALPRQSSRVLLLSSSMRGEGTTEIVVGLGLTLAALMGRKTAVMDCNTAHPDIHERFGVQDIGLDEHLNGQIAIDQALVNTTVPNLHVMPLGSHLTSLATISEDALKRVIASLRDRFDYVLIDSAAVSSSPEVTVLCDKVDAVVLVVRQGATRREVVRRAKDIFERAGGKILGVVLNKRSFPIPEFLYRRL